MIEEDEMPLPSYLIVHRDASLTTEQKAQLINWANSFREELGYARKKELVYQFISTGRLTIEPKFDSQYGDHYN